MKVCVGIPSYNEADRISFVVSQIDKGLKLLRENFPQINDCVILSADSCSSDDTIKRFDNTDTLFIKDSVLTKGEPGKGKNVLAILKYALENSCDVVLTIDADLESITPDWMLKFAELVINKKVDFVYPEYKLGDITSSSLSEMDFSDKQKEFGYDKRASLPSVCLACAYIQVCNGECPKNRFLKAPTGEPGLNYLCTGLMKYFSHITPAVNKLAADIKKNNPITV